MKEIACNTHVRVTYPFTALLSLSVVTASGSPCAAGQCSKAPSPGARC